MNTSTSRDMTQCAIDSSRYWSVLPLSPFAPGSGWKIRADTPMRSVRCVMRWPARSNSRRRARPRSGRIPTTACRSASDRPAAHSARSRAAGAACRNQAARRNRVAACQPSAARRQQQHHRWRRRSPGAPGSDAAVTGRAVGSDVLRGGAAGASGAFAGSVRGESEETEEVPGRPAGEGVFSLMTMVGTSLTRMDKRRFIMLQRTIERQTCNILSILLQVDAKLRRGASPPARGQADGAPPILDISDISQ